MARLLFDIETNGLLPELTTIHCIVAYDLDSGEEHVFASDEEGSIERGVKLIESADYLYGHSIQKFDIPAIRKLYPWFTPRGIIRDTSIISRLVWLNLKELDYQFIKKRPEFAGMVGKHSLKAWGMRLGVLKSDFGETTDWKTLTPEMKKYCIQDTVVNRSFLKHIESKQPTDESIELEQEFCLCLEAMEAFGWQFNEKKAVALYAKLSHRTTELEKELKTVFKPWETVTKTPDHYYLEADPTKRADTKGELLALAKREKIKKPVAVAGPLKIKYTEFNPGSRDHISRALIERYGWRPLAFGADGKPTVDEEVLAELPYPETPLLIEYLMLEKRVGMLASGNNAWLKLSKKGRIHGRVDHCGAISGRVTHKTPNMSQVPAVDKPWGPECRELFEANEGHLMVGIDAKGIQLRALAHYLAPFDGGKYVEAVLHGDIHKTNQLAAGLDTRDKSKTFIYAWVLGCGDEKAGEIAGVTAEEVERYHSFPIWEQVVAKYKRRNNGEAPSDFAVSRIIKGSQIKGQFIQRLPALGQLKSAVEARVKERGFLIGLDGRHLPIRSAHAAFSSLLQGFEAVVMKRATVQVCKKLAAEGHKYGTDYGLAGWIHDECQFSVTKELCDHVGRSTVSAIRESGEHFKTLCSLDGEYKIGANWKETH